MKKNIIWHQIFDSLKEANQTVPVNKAVLVTIDNLRICLAHSREGFFAVQDECTHLGETLSRGRLNYLNEVICPWHSYRFNLKTGEETTGKGCKDLKVYQVEIREDKLYIGV